MQTVHSNPLHIGRSRAVRVCSGSLSLLVRAVTIPEVDRSLQISGGLALCRPSRGHDSIRASSEHRTISRMHHGWLVGNAARVVHYRDATKDCPLPAVSESRSCFSVQNWPRSVARRGEAKVLVRYASTHSSRNKSPIAPPQRASLHYPFLSWPELLKGGFCP